MNENNYFEYVICVIFFKQLIYEGTFNNYQIINIFKTIKLDVDVRDKNKIHF